MKRQEIPVEEVTKRIEETFGSLEANRTKGLEQTRTVLEINNNAQVRERDRFLIKYGADHPRVISIQARIEYNQQALRSMDAEIERSKVAVPKFDVNSWRVHGRVLDLELKGVKGVTVALFDEQQWVQELGYACTDERGYFPLTYTPPVEGGANIPANLYLTVADKDKNILHREKEALSVVIGRIDYREIILGDEQPGGDTCVPPPTNGEEPGVDWKVKGRVYSAVSGKGLPELTVRLQDDAGLINDARGTTKTDGQGAFLFTFLKKDLPELFDKKPDVQVRVLDQTGKVVYESQTPIKVEAGKTEEVNIAIQERLTWGVKGTVTEATSGKPLSDLFVSLFDRENQFAEKLGATTTSSNGSFQLNYDSSQLPDLFEKTPLLFLRVTDPNHKVLFTSDTPMKVEAGKVEERDISIGPRGKQIWTVKGTVVNAATNRAVTGVTVNLFDREGQFTGKLAAAKTTARGAFQLTFEAEENPELFEKSPELFLRVTDKKGKDIFTSDTAVKIEPGSEQELNIKV